MKVHFDPQTFLRQRAGGISRLFTDLIREFDEDPALGVAATLPFRISNNDSAAQDLAHRGIRATPSWLPRGVLYAPWWVRGSRLPEGCDVVHHTYYSRRFLGAPRGVRQVTTVYDMIPELFAGTAHFTSTHLDKRTYVETCDLVICISESTRQDMVSLYGDIARRTVVVPLAVHAGFQPGLAAVPGLPAEYILYVGKRDGYKDFGLLPQALERLRDDGLEVPMVVVGSPLTAAESENLSQRGLAQSVVHASLDDSLLRRAYANATLLVQTSRYEGFGLTPLEGMASGVPVVVARASSMPEVGGDVAQYFVPGDADDLARAISECLGDTALRHELSGRGVERAAQFSTRQLAERTAIEYWHLLED